MAVYGVLSGLEDFGLRALSLKLNDLHPLVRYGLLVASDSATPASRSLTASSRLAAHLAGDDTIDAAILRIGGPVEVPSKLYVDSQQQQCMERVGSVLSGNDPVVLIVEGPQETGKRVVAGAACAGLSQRVIHIDASRAQGEAELDAALSALRRECLLTGATPLVARIDAIPTSRSERGFRALARWLEETPITVVLTTRDAGLDLGTRRKTVRVPLREPDISTRRALWNAELGDSADIDVDSLAIRYHLGAGGIQRAVNIARILAGDRPLSTDTVTAAVRNGIAERLGGLAQRVDVKQSWEDLILSTDTLDQIKSIIARVRHGHRVHEEWGFGRALPRGIGTAALFSGPPGTGKTMVAGLIARELDLELYQVDLSQVVSKWVGETEKQLAKIFDAAEAGHALILFDEADALFAKRTEVKSAVDRYANLEVNYLLQRIESFGGVAILTTNLDTSIDPALRRRLAGHVVFYPPELEDRARLWRGFLRKDAPIAGQLDFTSLAEDFPDMTGANIRNAVLAAAFLAAAESSAITQDHLRRAGRGEYRAMGRVIR